MGNITKTFTNDKNPSTMSTPMEVECNENSRNKKHDDDPIFPPEVMMEILTYLPLKSLTQRQLVCKEWLAFIHDHYFIDKHNSRSQVVYHWHNVYIKPGETSQNNPDVESVTYLHGCDGLILIRNNTSRKILLWNPATERVLELPDINIPHDNNYGHSFSFVPSSKNYRVMSFYKEKESGRNFCDVFTPGVSENWRSLPFPDNVNVNWSNEGKNVSVITAGGDVHCVLTLTLGGFSKFEEIVSLDVGNECFVVNHVPKNMFRDWSSVSALDWDGKLAFADVIGENLEVVELEDYKKHIWCETKKVFRLPFVKKKEEGGENETSVFPLFAKQGDIWFWLKGEKVISYTVGTGKVVDVKKAVRLSITNKLYPYRPSLVSFKGMQPADAKLQNLVPNQLV